MEKVPRDKEQSIKCRGSGARGPASGGTVGSSGRLEAGGNGRGLVEKKLAGYIVQGP